LYDETTARYRLFWCLRGRPGEVPLDMPSGC
jgi:hypothetical protein